MSVVLIFVLFSAIALILLVPAIKGMVVRPVAVSPEEHADQPRPPAR